MPVASVIAHPIRTGANIAKAIMKIGSKPNSKSNGKTISVYDGPLKAGEVNSQNSENKTKSPLGGGLILPMNFKKNNSTPNKQRLLMARVKEGHLGMFYQKIKLKFRLHILMPMEWILPQQPLKI